MAEGIPNPTVIPMSALAAIMTEVFSWIFDVARMMKVTKVFATEISRVTFRPYFCNTNPAIKANTIAPIGGRLAENVKGNVFY